MQSKKILQLSSIAAAIAAFYAYAGPEANAPKTVAAAAKPASQAMTALPMAKPGECYAKVIVPAQYKTEMVKVVAQEASVRYESIPAQYTTAEKKVLVKEAAKNIVPVPAMYETVQKTVELEPATRTWVVGRSFMAKPANDALLTSIKQSGINLVEQPEGSCLSEYYIPAQYKTEQVKVLKTAGYEKVEVEPAQYDWVEEKILVKEASKDVVEIPAVYETVSEKVMVSPATTQWKKGTGLYQKIDNTTGDIMCLVEVPAKYETVTRRVLKTPATTKEIEIPAEYVTQRVLKLIAPAKERRVKVEPTYQMFDKQVKVTDEQYVWQSDAQSRPAMARSTGQTVCLQTTEARLATVDQYQIKVPASTREIEIPAEYRTVAVRKLVKPAETRKIDVPPVVESVPKQVKISEERSEWQKVLCETNITPEIVTRLQTALQSEGLHNGPIDGHISLGTLRAVDEYQRAKGLERGGLTLNTLKALGVEI